MRILHVIHGFLPQFRGGTELYLLGLARAQRELGHEVEILTGTTQSADEPRVERYEFDGFPVTRVLLSGSYLEHWTRSFSPAATRLFVEAVQRIRPDVVHVQHWYRLSRSLIESCHRLGIPAVCTLHDLWTTCPRIFRIREESFCTRPLSAASCGDCVPRFPFMDDEGTAEEIDLFRADFRNEMKLARRIIVPSKAHGDVIADCAEIPESRLVVLPHGSIIDPDKATETAGPPRRRDPARRTSFGRRPPIRLGLWGHLFHMKGAHLLLEALGRLGKKSRRFELHVWGKVIEPRYKARLEQLAERLDVSWHGAYEPADLAEIELDCAVIPSLCSESFSFVLDEAFDLGLPVIVADRGALGERVGQAGAVFEAEDAESLARVLGRLEAEPERIERWRGAIPRLEPMARHARAVLALYGDVLDEDAPADLRADPGLPWRRLEHQTRAVRRHEALMFGQIGAIKRESGRGDHYEGEMRKLMHEKEVWAETRTDLEAELAEFRGREANENKIISVLAEEIETFRRSLVAYLRGDLGFSAERPEFSEIPEHVPGLGPVSTIVDQDHEILSNYGQELARRRGARMREDEENEQALGRKDEMITLLGREILAFRDLLLEVEAEAPRFDRPRPSAPTIPDHVPDLGPIARVLRENHEFMRSHFATLSRRLGDSEGASERAEELERRLEECETQRLELDGKLRGLEPGPSEQSPAAEAASAEFAESRQRCEDLEAELEAIRGAALESEALRKRLQGQEALVGSLAQLVEEMRRGIVAVWDADSDYEPRVVPMQSVVSDHVPGFGDLETIAEVNRQMLADLHQEIRRLRKGEAPSPDPEGADD